MFNFCSSKNAHTSFDQGGKGANNHKFQRFECSLSRQAEGRHKERTGCTDEVASASPELFAGPSELRRQEDSPFGLRKGMAVTIAFPHVLLMFALEEVRDERSGNIKPEIKANRRAQRMTKVFSVCRVGLEEPGSQGDERWIESCLVEVKFLENILSDAKFAPVLRALTR